MRKTRTKALSLALGAAIALGGVCAAFPARMMAATEVFAMDTGTQIEYPFATGADAFKYSPTFTMAAEQGAGNNKWEFVEFKFDGGAKDLREADYIAVQIKLDKSNPGFTFGLLDKGNRYMVGDNDPFYFLSEDGTLKSITSMYNAINLGVGACGTLIMPIASMKWQVASSDLSAVTSLYMTTNTQYNWDYVFTLGSVGYYNGEPDAADTQFTKLIDCSTKERAPSMYYVDATNPDCMKFPSQTGEVEPPAPAMDYPFRTGDDAIINAAEWGGFAVDGSQENQQTVTVKLGTADFSQATYLLVQYKCGGAPGRQYKLKQGDKAYSIRGKNGSPIYFLKEGETQSVKACNVQNDHLSAITNGEMGALIIPMSSMQWEGTAGDLSKIDSLVITTNARYNGGFDLVIGEVGLYKGEAGSGSFTKLLDLTDKQDSKFTVTSALDTNKGKITFFREPRVMLGDATVDFTAEKLSAASFTEEGSVGGGIWTGGSYGKREIVTDAYGDKAVQFTALGTNPNGDGYTAFDIAASGGFSWAGMKGVSFYARNDSDQEVSFNIEVDCRTLVNGKNVSDRFNIKQGNRFWLYDINTGKTTIYMTRPVATLPAGFEGWVRVPFTAFNRADWSNNGVTKDQFMDENSTVTYLAVTLHAATYANLSFTVNKFGGYTTTPQFSSSFIPSDGKSIPELMQLTKEEK